MAFNDLRIGAAFATANLVAMHLTKWTYLRSQKDTMGRYLLTPDPVTGQVNTIWGAKVITNTKIATGTAIVMDRSQAVLARTRMGLTIEINGYGDTQWSTNAVSSRAEERIAIGVQKPAAICIFTGLAAS